MPQGFSKTLKPSITLENIEAAYICTFYEFFISSDLGDNDIFLNVLDDPYIYMPPLCGIKITQNYVCKN